MDGDHIILSDIKIVNIDIDINIYIYILTLLSLRFIPLNLMKIHKIHPMTIRYIH
jgi:hypothetical protein